MTATTLQATTNERTGEVRSGSQPEFLGLTSTECGIDCTMESCCVTGKPYCGHPRKAGLQAVDKANPEMIRRYNRARKMLAVADAQQANYGEVL
jgi:hypothetical protein